MNGNRIENIVKQTKNQVSDKVTLFPYKTTLPDGTYEKKANGRNSIETPATENGSGQARFQNAQNEP